MVVAAHVAVLLESAYTSCNTRPGSGNQKDSAAGVIWSSCSSGNSIADEQVVGLNDLPLPHKLTCFFYMILYLCIGITSSNVTQTPTFVLQWSSHKLLNSKLQRNTSYPADCLIRARFTNPAELKRSNPALSTQNLPLQDSQNPHSPGQVHLQESIQPEEKLLSQRHFPILLEDRLGTLMPYCSG